MKHSKLSTALALATAMGGLAGGLFTQPAGAVNLSTQNLGDVLIFPYYTARAGWMTEFNLINTSDTTLAVRLTFYEGYNSRDALNFTIVLSPKDQFVGAVEDTKDGPVFKQPAGDNTCMVPNQKEIKFERFAYSGGNADHTAAIADKTPDGLPGLSTIDRAREGYMVATVMGYSPAGTENTPSPYKPGVNKVAYNANHVAGLPRDCKLVEDAFRKQGLIAAPVPPNPVKTFSTIYTTASEFGEPTNVLKGNYNLRNTALGVSAGGGAVALANFVAVSADDSTPALPRLCTAANMFFNPATMRRFTPGWDPAVVLTQCPNLIAAQQSTDYLLPSLADAYPNRAVVLNDHTWTVSYYQDSTALPPPAPAAATTIDWGGYGYGYMAVSEVLRAASLVNEWSLNPDLGASTEWVVTHPTKNFFVDGYSTVYSANSQQNFPADQYTRLISVPYPPFAEAFTLAGYDGQSCNRVTPTVYDRDEQVLSGNWGQPIVPSPVPRSGALLCFESNVIKFRADDGKPGSDVLGSRLVLDLSANGLNAMGNAGWMNLDLTTESVAKSGALVSRPEPIDEVINLLPGDGLPAVGFMIKQRLFGKDEGGKSMSYAHLSDHSYKGRGVPCDPETSETCGGGENAR